MAKDAPHAMRLDDLSEAEIGRIEAMVFGMGGPPDTIGPALLWRAAGRTTPPEVARAA